MFSGGQTERERQRETERDRETERECTKESRDVLADYVETFWSIMNVYLCLILPEYPLDVFHFLFCCWIIKDL